MEVFIRADAIVAGLGGAPRMTGGHGRVMVLIHGWGFSHAIWNPVAARLRDVPLWIPDLPGHGAAPGGAALQDVRALGRSITEQLPPGSREPIWVGWSLGGLVALAAAACWRGPQRVALVCATPRFTTDADWPNALRSSALEAFGEELVRDRSALETHFASLCAHGDSVPVKLRRHLLGAMGQHPARLEGLRAGLAALARTDLRAELVELDAPVSAWLAQADALVPSVSAGLTALRPDTRLHLRAGGHASWLQEPSALVDFLREVAA